MTRQQKIFRSLVAAGLSAAVAALSSCSSYGPAFDPYAATGPGGKKISSTSTNLDNPEFSSVDSPGSGIPSQWLRPSKEPYRIGPGDELLIEVVGIAGTSSTTFV